MLVYWFCQLWNAIPPDINARGLCVLFSIVETALELGVIGALILNWLDTRKK